MSYFYQFKSSQLLKADLETVWDFIKDPNNLSKITPKHMDFRITVQKPTQMYQGLMIGYKVRPILGIPLTWLTEITHVEEKSYFVDEQRLGPYKIWHHEHFLEVHPEGVLMKDIVTYCIGFGILDPLLNRFLIGGQIQQIFDYRAKVLEQMFNSK